MSDEREQRYAEAISLALGFTQPLRPHQMAARAAIEVANAEQQACASDNDRLIAENERLRERINFWIDGKAAWAREAEEQRARAELAEAALEAAEWGDAL